ncbi:unknown [Prevotella sp. CAG:1124]|nr:unknown [Prevotella sp. CAG:1124]
MTKPPSRRPLKRCASRRNALALPSKWVMSAQNPGLTLSFSERPLPSVKNVCIAFSPECPNGGLPMSCARHAVLTIVPICGNSVSASSGLCFITPWATSLPSESPTLATSRLWVRRLCTKILPGKGNTWVLFCMRLNGAENISRS